jgi:YQGE family putative transporter
MFGSAYLWRAVNDPIIVILFNVGLYLGIPVGFYGNAILLKRIPVRVMYGGGFLGLGISMLLFVLIGSISPIGVCLGGAVVGLFLGAYWANRIILTLHMTHDAERDFFFALDTMILTIMSVLMPAIFGTLIQARFFAPTVLNERSSYLLLLVLALLGFVWGGFRIGRLSFTSQPPGSLWHTAKGKVWNNVTVVMFGRGFADAGVGVLPIILPMLVFGGETGLGGLQSGAALITAFVIYMIGRNIGKPAIRLGILKVATALVILAAVILCCGVTQGSVLAYGLVNGLGTALIWLGINPIVYGAIQQVDPRPEHWMTYVCHRELSLNVGRLLGAGFLIVLLYVGREWALQWSSLPFALSQVAVVWGACRLVGAQREVRDEIQPQSPK